MFKLDDLKGVTLAMLINYLEDINPPINRKKDIDRIRQLIISLKNNTIDNLKTQFMANNNNVTLEKFIWLMRQCILYNSENKHQFYYELVRLFQQIDIDNNQSIDWNEFLEFLSCNGWTQTQQNRDDEQISAEKKIIQSIFKETTKFRKNPIMNIVQMQRNNLLLLHESRSNHIKFITNQGESSNFGITTLQNSKILSIDYSEAERLFGIMLISKKIWFIEEGEIQKNYGSISSKGNQNLIKYLPYHKLWLLQTIDHQFTIFTSPKIVAAQTLTMGNSSKIRNQKIIFKPHTEPITSIKEITNPLALCTSSLDGKIKLWSIQNKQLIIQISAGLEEEVYRNKGLRGLDCYNYKITSYMVCWTFTQQICLWLPSISLTKPYVGLLKGHIGIVEECRFSPSNYDKSLLLSIDNKKWVKIWNVELQSCLQTIGLQQQNCHFYFLKSRPWLVIYNKLLTFYKIKSLNSQQSPQKQKDFDTKNISENQLISISFSNYYDYLLILTQDQLKVIEINTTEAIQSIRCEDPSLEYWVSMSKKIDRKIFLASNTCWIYLYNIDNGLLLNKFQPQHNDKQFNMMIKFIHFQKKYSILIICGQVNDNSVVLSYDESLSGETKKIKEAVFAQINIQHYAFCEKTDIFFLGSDNGLITIWLLDKLIIANKIQVNSRIQKMEIQDSRSLVFILTNKNLILYQVQPTGFIKLSKTIFFAISRPLTFSFVYSTQHFVLVQNSQQQQQLKIKRRLNIKTYLRYIDTDEMEQYTARFERNIHKKLQRCILCIADYSHTYFYDITDIMNEFLPTDNIFSRNKQHKLKQSRKVIIKSNLMSYPSSTIGLDFGLFKDILNTTFSQGVKNIIQYNGSGYGSQVKYLIGNVCGMFYHRIHNGIDSNINMFKPSGKLCGKWSLNSSKSKLWNIHYPTIHKILNRLAKIYEILKKIDIINDLQSYQLLFLANRFLDKQGLKKLKDLYRTKVTFADEDVQPQEIDSKVSLQNDVKVSKKSQFSVNKFKAFDEIKNHTLYANKSEAGNSNIFDVMYEHRTRNAEKIQKYKLENIEQRFNKIAWNTESQLKMKADVDKRQQQLLSKQKRGTSEKVLSKFRIKSSIVNAMNNFRNQQKNYQLLSKKMKNLGSGLNLKL